VWVTQVPEHTFGGSEHFSFCSSGPRTGPIARTLSSRATGHFRARSVKNTGVFCGPLFADSLRAPSRTYEYTLQRPASQPDVSRETISAELVCSCSSGSAFGQAHAVTSADASPGNRTRLQRDGAYPGAHPLGSCCYFRSFMSGPLVGHERLGSGRLTQPCWRSTPRTPCW
jgi:hypothetical protein